MGQEEKPVAQIKDLRGLLAEARRRERLHEFTEPINKEWAVRLLHRDCIVREKRDSIHAHA